MAKHRNVRTGHLHDLGHISVQSNSYFTPRGLVYGVLWWVYGRVWSHMVIGDVMSHALKYIEIGNSLSFPLEIVYMGSGTHIKSVLYK
jgi:hypothetical protein